MIYVAMLKEGYTNDILWISHHKTPEGAANACKDHADPHRLVWEESFKEYTDTGFRRESVNYGHDHYEIESFELHL